jgi:hypothetical protein
MINREEVGFPQTCGREFESISTSDQSRTDQVTSSETPTQPARFSLDLRFWMEFREQAHRMLDDMLTYTETIRGESAWRALR